MYIDETMADDSLDERPLLRKLTDGARPTLFRMHVHVSARDIQIAAHDERPGGFEFCGVGVHRLEKPHLRGKVLPAIRHINRRDRRLRQLRGDDAVLVVELGMVEQRTIGMCRLADVETDA